MPADNSGQHIVDFNVANPTAKLPVEEREEAFVLLFRTYALALGEDTPAAAQWVESVMLGIRQLVAEIDNNGARYLTVRPRLM